MSTPTAPSHVDIRTMAPKASALSAIERELRTLWQSAAESAEAGRGAAVTRTCLANLVVLVHERDAAEQATTVIDQLTDIYPNRAIVVTALPGPPALAAWVQAHCKLPAPGRPQVCGEQITVEASGEATVHIPGVVLPLLVPDVPVVLWLPRGEPSEHPAAAKLTDVVDRLIVDSATFTAPEHGLAAILGLLDADTGVSDLAWARLTAWRELLAQFFDDPAMLAHLAEVEDVRLTIPHQPGATPDRSQALLLVGWLATRLGWRVAEDGARLLRPDGGPIALEMSPLERPEQWPDRLLAVAIGCRRAQFSVARIADSDTAVARAKAEGRWPIDRTVRLDRLDDAALLAGELRLLGRDRSFEEALRLATALASRV
jgi:glucose-6-phosphate dehydrogenase assembly protein OpcA